MNDFCARMPSKQLNVSTYRVCLAIIMIVLLAFSSAHLAQAQSGVAPVITVGDALQIDFLDDDDAPLPLDVGGDGTVQLPFIGAVDVAGRALLAARDVISDLYVERGIFLAPQIELSFVAMRPLSVLGDVRTPGFYDYRAFITVEQAIGLAGGIMRSSTSEEGRSMQRASLRGDLARANGDMTREAVEAARLNTQINGGLTIDADAVTVAGLEAPDRALIRTLVAQDNRIIAAERAHFGSQTALLEQAVTDAKLQIDLTEDQIVAQEAQISSYDAELESNAELADRGLVAAPVRARLLRQVADEKTDLLRLRTSLASARLQLTGLERQRLDLDYQRRQTWRQALADSAVRAAQFLANRETVLDRMAVLEGWSARMAEAEARIELEYVIRRRGADGAYDTMEAAETDELSPGDVLIVRVTGAEALAQAAVEQQP